MSKYYAKIIEYGFYLFIFLLPWQTRWIWQQGYINGGLWEYGTFSVYATDFLFLVILFLSFFLKNRPGQKIGIFSPYLFGFFLICFTSIFWTVNKDVSWYFIGRLLQALLLVWIVVRVNVKWPALAVSFVLSGVVQSALGIYQFFSQQVTANKWLGLAAHAPDVLGDFVVETASGRFLRAYGSLPSPNILGGFLVVCLVFLICLIFYVYGHRPVRLWKVIAMAAAFVVIFQGLIFTFSRSAWLALGAVLVGMLIMFLWQGDRLRLRALTRVAVWICLIIIFSVVLIPDVWQTRLAGSGRLENKSVEERGSGIDNSLEIISQNWTHGTGIGTYTQALRDFLPNQKSWEYQPVHLVYLLVAGEIGLFGVALLLLVIFEFFRKTLTRFKNRHAGFVSEGFLATSFSFLALLVVSLFDHYLWSLAFGLILFWLMFGLWVRQWLEEGRAGLMGTLVDKLFHRQS
jgi:hypothetical protein